MSGRDKPFSYSENGCTKDFVRARASIAKQTGEPIFISNEARQVHNKLVSLLQILSVYLLSSGLIAKV
jgi:hypothetical protein